MWCGECLEEVLGMKVDLMFCPPYRCARGEEAGWVEDGLLKCFGTFT